MPDFMSDVATTLGTTSGSFFQYLHDSFQEDDSPPPPTIVLGDNDNVADNDGGIKVFDVHANVGHISLGLTGALILILISLACVACCCGSRLRTALRCRQRPRHQPNPSPVLKAAATDDLEASTNNDNGLKEQLAMLLAQLHPPTPAPADDIDGSIQLKDRVKTEAEDSPRVAPGRFEL